MKRNEYAFKQCRKCGDYKSLAHFSPNAEMKDGRTNECKKCTREYNKAWREKNAPKEGFYSAEESRRAYGNKSYNKWDDAPVMESINLRNILANL